jgi:DNA repair protein RecN (Recombination protein N)
MEKLAFLDMERCQFTVSITPSEKYTALGHDTVEFFMSANPGESPEALAKIASGGELSRIMLSIIHALSEKDRPDTMIFDEVDSGVSGKTAQKIGVLLKEVSRQSQVLCVTHLAQIAAMADNHLLITKKAIENQTFTQVSQLDHEGRRREVARIVGGINITETTLNTADELIAAGNL